MDEKRGGKGEREIVEKERRKVNTKKKTRSERWCDWKG